jgi:hypothetical protein
MIQQENGSLTISMRRGEWKTRNPETGVLTLRCPVDRPGEPTGHLTYFADGSTRLVRLEGDFEEEYPDGRRVLTSALGIVQTISPRLDQGVQVDVDLVRAQAQLEQYFILMEEEGGAHRLLGGQSWPGEPSGEVVREERFPWGACRREQRDGRILRDLTDHEMSFPLIEGRTVTFVPRAGRGRVVGQRVFSPGLPARDQFQNGVVVETQPDGSRHYHLPGGQRVG